MVLLWTVKSAWSNENVQKVQSRESDRWKVEVAANETVVSEVLTVTLLFLRRILE